MDQLIGHSITYRIAVGPQAGRKVFTLQTLPDSGEPFDDPVGQVSGFSLHAGVAAKAHQRQKLERLCRYISRPAVSEKRLSLTANGNIRYQLKTQYRDGTTYVIFEPLDFIARLAALVPEPRVNLTRFHGVFAPNRRDRAAVTPAKRGKGAKPAGREEEQEKTPAQRRAAMSLNAAPQTRLRHRHRDLCGLRRGAADHRLHRRPRGDQEDSHPHRQQKRSCRTRPVAALSGTTTGALVPIEPTSYDSSHTTGADPDRPGREALGLTIRTRPNSPRLRTISRLGRPREAGTHPDDPPKVRLTAT